MIPIVNIKLDIYIEVEHCSSDKHTHTFSQRFVNARSRDAAERTCRPRAVSWVCSSKEPRLNLFVAPVHSWMKSMGVKKLYNWVQIIKIVYEKTWITTQTELPELTSAVFTSAVFIRTIGFCTYQEKWGCSCHRGCHFCWPTCTR